MEEQLDVHSTEPIANRRSKKRYPSGNSRRLLCIAAAKSGLYGVEIKSK
jgi:hypothetical protein